MSKYTRFDLDSVKAAATSADNFAQTLRDALKSSDTLLSDTLIELLTAFVPIQIRLQRLHSIVKSENGGG